MRRAGGRGRASCAPCAVYPPIKSSATRSENQAGLACRGAPAAAGVQSMYLSAQVRAARLVGVAAALVLIIIGAHLGGGVGVERAGNC